MKEFVSIVASFLVVVGFAFFMYVSNQKHSIAVIEAQELEKMVKEKDEELKQEIIDLKNHIKLMDSIYHKE